MKQSMVFSYRRNEMNSKLKVKFCKRCGNLFKGFKYSKVCHECYKPNYTKSKNEKIYK